MNEIVSGYATTTRTTGPVAEAGESQQDTMKLLLKAGSEDSGQIFAILDTARNDAIMSKLALAENQYESLFRGTEAEKHFAVSPILTECREGTELLRWLAEDVWGSSCGVFLVSGDGFINLVTHFRRLLLVKDAAGAEFYFRFYDPRVLRLYLPTCTAAEINHVHGTVTRFLIESEVGGQVLGYSKNDPGAGRATAATGPTDSLGKLIIRDPQMTILSEAMLVNYESRMVNHLRQRFPAECRPLGDDGVLEFVKYGIKRAEIYDIKTEMAVQEYLELMMVFGRDFDTDSSISWAGPILHDHSFVHGKARADKLYATGMVQATSDDETGPEKERSG